MAKSEFQNSTPWLHFQSRGIFVIFQVSGAFSQIGLPYLIFTFWGVWCHQFMETRFRLAKYHVLPLKYAQNELIIVRNYGENPHFIILCINIHDLIIPSIWGLHIHPYWEKNPMIPILNYFEWDTYCFRYLQLMYHSLGINL